MSSLCFKPEDNLIYLDGVRDTGLKKTTTFIKGLSEPIRSYMRLGWLEVEKDEYQITSKGRQALEKVQFGLTGDEKTLSAFCTSRSKKTGSRREEEKVSDPVPSTTRAAYSQKTGKF